MTVIEVKDLCKSYGRIRAVDGVSFTVKAGETFGVLGHNGAGKTTTVECLTGLRKPDAGRVRVLGEDPVRRRRALAARVGVQLQEGELPDRIKVAEAMRLFAAFYQRPDDWRAVMRRWDLGPVENKAYGDLSGGQKQRLKLALALVGAPERWSSSCRARPRPGRTRPSPTTLPWRCTSRAACACRSSWGSSPRIW